MAESFSSGCHVLRAGTEKSVRTLSHYLFGSPPASTIRLTGSLASTSCVESSSTHASGDSVQSCPIQGGRFHQISDGSALGEDERF